MHDFTWRASKILLSQEKFLHRKKKKKNGNYTTRKSKVPVLVYFKQNRRKEEDGKKSNSRSKGDQSIDKLMVPLPVRMFKATITVAISAIEGSVGHAKYLGGSLHFQFFALNGIHNASRERLLPELLAASRRQVIVHLHDVSELLGDRWVRGVGIRGSGRRCSKIKPR